MPRKRKINAPSRALVRGKARGYSAAPLGAKRAHQQDAKADPKTGGSGMSLLFAKKWKREGAGEYKTKTLEEAIKGIHDVLVTAAAAEGTEVEIVCANLGGFLRDLLWHHATRTTFAQQIEDVLTRGGTVKIFVMRTAQEHGPVAPSLVERLRSFEQSGAFKINFKAIHATIPQQFPHFTIARLKSTAWYAAVEWYEKHQAAGEVEDWDLSSTVHSSLYGHTKTADEVCSILSKRFEDLFRPATKSTVVL